MIAHVGGLPVEEVLPLLMSGGGAWMILRLTFLGARLRPTRQPPTGRGGASWSGRSRQVPDRIGRSDDLGISQERT